MTKPVQKQVGVPQPGTEAKALQESVQRMQTQFANTGTVQATDMARVLGNPVGGIEMELRRTVANSAWKTI